MREQNFTCVLVQGLVHAGVLEPDVQAVGVVPGDRHHFVRRTSDTVVLDGPSEGRLRAFAVFASGGRNALERRPYYTMRRSFEGAVRMRVAVFGTSLGRRQFYFNTSALTYDI